MESSPEERNKVLTPLSHLPAAGFLSLLNHPGVTAVNPQPDELKTSGLHLPKVSKARDTMIVGDFSNLAEGLGASGLISNLGIVASELISNLEYKIRNGP